jgi:hypothetical protein
LFVLFLLVIALLRTNNTITKRKRTNNAITKRKRTNNTITKRKRTKEQTIQ